MDRNSRSFKVTKWTMVTLCFISLVSTLVDIGLTAKLVDNYVDKHYINLKSEEDIELLKHVLKTLIYMSTVLAVIVDLVGLLGAYTESYCMTITYAMLISLCVGLSVPFNLLMGTFGHPYYCFTFVFTVILCAIAYSFGYRLRCLRLSLRLQALPRYRTNIGSQTEV